MANDAKLMARTQPGTQVAVTYPPDELDAQNGWRIYSGPGADQEPETEILPWVSQRIEEVPF